MLSFQQLFNQGDSTSFLSKGATYFCKVLKINTSPVQSLTSTIPSLGHYFQRTDLCCPGGSRTLHPSPDFHSRAFCHLNYKTSFCLEVIASPPYSTTPDYHGLPLWILNLRISIISSLNPCKIYRILSIILDNDDSFRVVFCLYKLFGARFQIGHIQIRTGTTTPLASLFL